MRFSPRFVLVLCALVGLSMTGGCSKLSFMPQPRKKVVAGYDAVQSGMSERQVVQLLGKPTRRSGIMLEGGSTPGKALTFVGGGHLTTVMLSGDSVVGKDRH